MALKSGDVVRVSRAASCQFTQPFNFRIIHVDKKPTWVGWTWLDGYQLADSGAAVERRSIFVRVAGLSPISQRRRI